MTLSNSNLFSNDFPCNFPVSYGNNYIEENVGQEIMILYRMFRQRHYMLQKFRYLDLFRLVAFFLVRVTAIQFR